MTRKPDVDLRALQTLVERAVPGSDRPLIARTADGTSTQVYRVERDGRTFYLRVAEERDASLAPEALAHGELRARSVCVPEVVYFDRFDAALERSVMVTSEIPGRSLARHHAGVDIRSVLIEAGRDLAAFGAVAVRGFGWISRDRRVTPRLEAERSSLRGFAVGALEQDLSDIVGLLDLTETQEVRRAAIEDHPWPWLDHGHLAHGDFDATHIYHQDGRYTRIIDLGEIRGADRFYDLGHFALHDGETMPRMALPDLLEGFAQVTPLPPDHERRIHLWSVVIGVGRLARLMDRPLTPYRDYLIDAVRRSLAALRA